MHSEQKVWPQTGIIRGVLVVWLNSSLQMVQVKKSLSALRFESILEVLGFR